MNTIDLRTIKQIHMIGIGGIGISALAQFLINHGKKITANDLEEFPMVSFLRKKGVRVVLGSSPEVIPEGTDLIVYSGAWVTLGPELLLYAKTLGVPVLSYPEMLSIISKNTRTIAIAGSHGKTTTTAMVAHVLIEAKRDPTVIVGSVMKELGSNFRAGKSDLLVIEADEYRRAFLNLTPEILVITNIDLDHLDYYKDIADIKSAYRELIAKMPKHGVVIYDSRNIYSPEVVSGAPCRVVDYRTYLKHRDLRKPGEHYQLDAAAACAVASELGISAEVYDRIIVSFQGTARRLEEKGRLESGTLVIDDYAHHPVEIKATLAALRQQFPPSMSRIVVLFHPHLYSRTRTLWEGFVSAFSNADTVCLLPIYAAREAPEANVTSEKLATAINAKRSDLVHTFSTFEEAAEGIRKMKLGPNDVFVTMGAGEAFKVGDILLKKEKVQ
jgi:UDP-N-acetylmuramate--alanine ligase